MNLTGCTLTQITELYRQTRQYSEQLCEPLAIEDFNAQPTVEVSPPKWHLAHTTWFFESFLLEGRTEYKPCNGQFSYFFNSYYHSLGERVARDQRGALTRPTVAEIMDYRHHVDEAVIKLIGEGLTDKQRSTIELGLNHEEQHQELLVYDIKYILGHQPTFPKYNDRFTLQSDSHSDGKTAIEEGIYSIGFEGSGFHFDNEKAAHRHILRAYEIDNQLVTNGEYLEFMEDGGYSNPLLFHSDGWNDLQERNYRHPEYWIRKDEEWHEFELSGLQPLNLRAPVKHLSYYEAWAFAEWKNRRLPTEAEWEVAAQQPDFSYGKLWEWTESAYMPYPGFRKPDGAIGEYNAKFMVNQLVLRGGSIASPKNHVRRTYRNFFTLTSVGCSAE
jgi:ergothioneine biosynthesis protein EgtB